LLQMMLFSGYSGVEFTFHQKMYIISQTMHHSILCLFYLYLRNLLRDGKKTDMVALSRK